MVLLLPKATTTLGRAAKGTSWLFAEGQVVQLVAVLAGRRDVVGDQVVRSRAPESEPKDKGEDDHARSV